MQNLEIVPGGSGATAPQRVRKAEVPRQRPVKSVAGLAPADRSAGEDRYRMIAEAAYFRAEQRGFLAGSEVADWLAAEIEVDEILGDEAGR